VKGRIEMSKKSKNKKAQERLQKIKKGSNRILSELNKSSTHPNSIPQSLLHAVNDPGAFFGLTWDSPDGRYVGMKQGSDGHILVVGGSGSGKSSGIAKPTLRTWSGPMCVTDINGELSARYHQLYMLGDVTLPYIRFDPTDLEGPSYDPLRWLMQDGDENLISNIQEMALALIPIQPEDKQPFWVETERAVLEAAFLYYIPLGLSFPEIIAQVMSLTMTELCTELGKSKDIRIKNLLGEMTEMKAETIASVDRGLRNKLKLFATDPHISHALRGERENAKCFSWDDLADYNVFLHIPENLIPQWGPLIILMLTQLIRYLERRPNKYSAQGDFTKQTLLLLDEFPRFGKLEMISDAISTLRNKKVNIALITQSFAQLDKIYGVYDRRIICENCGYKVILQAADVDTQKYISELFGTYEHNRYSLTKNMNESLVISSYGVHQDTVEKLRILPHQLSSLNDVLLLTPYGSCRAEKLLPDDEMKRNVKFTIETSMDREISSMKAPNEFGRGKMQNKNAKMLTNEERLKNAEVKIAEAVKKQQQAEKQAEEEAQERRLAEKMARENDAKRNQRRCYIVGEMVINEFPELMSIIPGTRRENEERFKLLASTLAAVTGDLKLLQDIRIKGKMRLIVEEHRHSQHQKQIDGQIHL